MNFPNEVYLRELGPREGFQTLTQVLSTEAKLALIRLLNLTGVPEIEITSFVRPDKVPQMADAEEVVKNFEKKAGVTYTALCLNAHGFARGEALGRLDNDGWIYLAASETFFKRNNNLTIADAITKIPEQIAHFKSFGKTLRGVMISAAFGCNYEGVVEHETVIEILQKALRACEENGAVPLEISLADTMGWASPVKLRVLIEKTREKFSNSQISLHLHDTRGCGMANVYAGLEAGISIFDCSIGGMGGCPFAKGAAGNVATEDVAYLCAELGIRTGTSLTALVTAAKYAEQLVGAPLPGKLYKCWE